MALEEASDALLRMIDSILTMLIVVLVVQPWLLFWRGRRRVEECPEDDQCHGD